MIDASNTPTLLGERYELEEKLARGGMADVFLARDQVLDRRVAVKVLFPQFAVDPDFVERFRREAQSAGRLNHPSIVAVYDWGSHDDTYFIAMEYVEGQSLARVLSAAGPLNVPTTLPIVEGVLQALDFAHRAGTVHRDIKPGNVILTPTGQVKVADFGIARALDADDDLTQAGKVMGTAGYFSPEQARGEAVDTRSDLYSVGIMLFEMLTGERPFTGTSPLAVAYHHIETPAPAPSERRSSVPPELDAIVAKLLAKRPDDRYSSAEEVQADLARVGSGEPLIFGGPASQAETTSLLDAPEQAPNTSANPRSGPASGRHSALATSAQRPTGSPRRAPAPAKTRNGLFIGILALLLVAAGALTFVFLNAIGGDDATSGSATATGSVVVPDVTGQELDAAAAALVDDGLVVAFEFELSDEPDDLVFRQDPEPGLAVEAGTEVTIFISRSDDAKEVPRVTGLTQDEAFQNLQAAGFVPEVTDEQFHESVALGDVISQNVPAGDSANPGVTVGLIISLGPPPPEETTTSAPAPTSSPSSALSSTTNSSRPSTTSSTSTTATPTSSTAAPTTTTTEPTTTTTASPTTTSSTTTTTTTTTIIETSAPPAAGG